MNKQEFIAEIYHFANGLIKTVRHEFETLEEALRHVESVICHSFKVFDHNGQVCHSGQSGQIDTYA